ncbi:bacillithiol biosynthesis cysteine-adding enzyme BshC [Halobacillus mangrovi]|uniref:Putative cysteine ligase BshC n=1 Tax=Halobacillus mangrovi TaxID=402384 RepID=A0A1W5ZWC5_9BACI|nr:bacillithiol biosynthesis cysteine-adding enzyme BshC [Halobacillus mangrovi]ARI77579.1 bacillithiol biosynthesis cysteine-adding enzyme BshC [Halobacillus mangrovi]
MRIDPIALRSKQLLFHDYKNNFQSLEDKFEYNPQDQSIWSNRFNYLRNNNYQREALSTVIQHMNEKWGAPSTTCTNIEKLKREESTVVIAGQQAGLMTGPLYTVHKIISVLQLARQKEKELNKPVIPIFWIAGEDHDFDEINHLFMKENQSMKKITIQQIPEKKASVSDITIAQENAENWVNQIFQVVKETEFTSDFYHQVVHALKQSESYSDFFARLVYLLFPEEGLVVVDAHDPHIRNLESPYFKTMIEKNEDIAKGVFSALQINRQQGYETVLDSEWNDAHLFYHHNGERVLLSRDEDGSFRGKNNEVAFSKEELLQVAEENPEHLSNNVVTRPLMQESLFPVLAFIGGPGEINYWAVLKPAFQAAGMQMPPVLPRLSFTLIDRKAEQTMDRLQIEAVHGVQYGTGEEKMKWLASRNSPPIQELSKQVKSEIDRIHRPLREKSSDFGPDIEQLAEKNLQYIFQDIDFLEKRMIQSLEQKYEQEITQFDDLGLLLHPGGGLQERMWSIVPWVNQHGTDLFQRINQHHYSFDQDHYVVYV